MKVLVDETYHKFDDSHYCFVVAHVIASDDAIQRFHDWYNKKFLPDTLRFKNKKKVHFTDEDTAVKQHLTEVVKDLEVTAKMYVWYGTGAIEPANIMKWSLGFQLQTNPDSEFIIEESGNVYDSLDSERVRISSSENNPELAIADIFAGVYVAKTVTKQIDQTTNRLYSFLYPRIRLEMVNDYDGKLIKKVRNKKTMRVL